MDYKANAGVVILQLMILKNVLGITNVRTVCPPDRLPGSKARVTIVSDETTWEAFGFCEPLPTLPFGDFEFIDTGDRITKSLDVYFSVEGDTEACIFGKHENKDVEVYQMSVEIYNKFGDEFHTVTCAFQDLNETENDDVKHQDKSLNVTDLEFLSKVQIHQPKGRPAHSELELYLVDIKNQPIGNRKWRFGRYLKLAVEMSEPKGDEVSFQVTDCFAKSLGQNQTYTLLTVGCGDGVIIPPNKGFITSGKMAYSTPFKAFELIDSTKIVFKCSFLICKGNCDGSSCENPRMKRDTGAYKKYPNASDDGKEFRDGPGRSHYWRHSDVMLDARDTGERADSSVEDDFKTNLYIGLGFFLSLIIIVSVIYLNTLQSSDTSDISTSQKSLLFP